MKQLYAKVSGMFAIALVAAGSVHAQNPTTVVNANCGVVTENFNSGNANYSSPSVYGNITFDSAFWYNSERGYWTEMGSTVPGTAGPQTPGRVTNIVSPPYINPNPVGVIDVGFYYIVPNPSADRFNVSVVQLTTVTSPGGDVTYEEVVARSGFRFFSDFSTPAAYVDPDNPLHNGFEGGLCIRLIDPDITNAANTTYRVEVTYLLTGTTFAAFDDFSLGDIEAIPLPVNFLGFFGRQENGANKLFWNVGEEHNVDRYEIERSTDGINFGNIGEVSAEGKNIYTFTDHHVQPGVNYYRVRNVDIDGRYKYTNIVKMTTDEGAKVKLYPVPAGDEAFIQHERANAGSFITLHSPDGKMLRRQNLVPNTVQTRIELAGLQSGLYFVRYDDGEGNTLSLKLLKSR